MNSIRIILFIFASSSFLRKTNSSNFTKYETKIYGNFDNYFSQNEIPYQPFVSISYNWSQKYYLIISDILWKIVYRSTQRMHGTINACTCIYSFYNHKKEFLIVRRKE